MPEIIKFPLRMSETVQSKILQHYKADNCASQNEFILKALNFYNSYLEGQNLPSFLSEALLNAMEGTYQISQLRMASNLFRLSVEMNMMMHLLATTLDITDEELRSLRSHATREVKNTKGRITMEDAIAFQQGDM